MGASGLHQILAAGMLHLQVAPGNSNKYIGLIFCYRDYRGSIGTIGSILGLYWDSIGIMETKMETIGIIGIIQLYRLI